MGSSGEPPPAHTAAMGHGYVDPFSATGGPCWHCTGFQGMVYEGTAAWCCRPGAPAVRSQPAGGCSGFVREVGTDDEPGPPGGERPDPPDWRAMMARTQPRSLYEPGRNPLTEGT